MTFGPHGVQITVVSCVTPHGIVRGISHWTPPCHIVEEIAKAIGICNVRQIEWTGATYFVPSYMAISGWDQPGGVYLYRWKVQKSWPNREVDGGQTWWTDPKRRKSEQRGELLFRPCGWAGDRADRDAGRM